MDNSETLRRSLRWRMRRGLLELDIVLERFAADAFDGLTPAELAQMARLLEWPDQEFLAVLQSHRPNPEPEFEPLLAKIRTAARF